MDLALLEKLGLTETEAKVYVNLIKLGSTKAGPLVKKTELHRATVYDVLKRLMEKGLATYITIGKTKHYEATDPGNLLEEIEKEKEELKKKEEAAEKAVKELKDVKKRATHENAHFYQGKRALKNVFDEMLEYDSYDCFGSGKFRGTLGPYFDKFQKIKEEREIDSRVLLPESGKGADYTEIAYANYGWLPDEYASPANTFIYGDKVAMFIWIDTPIAVVVESEELAETYRNYFELLWETAEK